MWHAVLLHKLKMFVTSGLVSGLTSFFLSNRQLCVVLDGTTLQEYPVNGGVSQGSIHDHTLFLLYINYLTVDIICNIAIYVDNSVIRHLIYGIN